MKLKAYDNDAPVITSASVSSAIGDRDIYINYTIADVDSDLISMKLEYSTDSGATWKL